jgi:hypothetical protein
MTYHNDESRCKEQTREIETDKIGLTYTLIVPTASAGQRAAIQEGRRRNPLEGHNREEGSEEGSGE